MNKKYTFRANSNSWLQIVQPEFTTWKYKVKLSAETPERRCSVTKLFLKFRNIQRKTRVWESHFDKIAGLVVLRTPTWKTSANGCIVHNMSLKT